MRKVIVFRLHSVDPSPSRTDTTVSQLAKETGKAEAPGSTSTDNTADVPASTAQLVPVEQHQVHEATQPPRAGLVAAKQEAKLVQQFENHLRRQGREIGRYRITIAGERAQLVTDTYDVTDGALYEAKSGADRATVRLGVGQILDYLRHITPRPTGYLLLPSEPSADLQNFVSACGLGITYPRLGSWIRHEP